MGNDATGETIGLPNAHAVEVVPLLVIGSGRASLTLISHLPERMLSGAVVVDPSGEWLETWALRCMRQGVTFLRQPVTAVPFPDATSLRDYIAARGDREQDISFGNDGQPPQPSCRVFAEYCASRIGEHSSRIGRARLVADVVVSLTRVPRGELPDAPRGGLRVALASGGSILAEQVVHAGRWSTPVVPGWMLDAKLLAGNQAPRDSLASFADVDVRGLRLDGRDVVVVGGGMRACALALAAHERGARLVTLMSRGEIRIAERECDASFFGNKGVRAFRAAREPTTRLEALRRARSGRASVDARTWSRVREAEEVSEGSMLRVVRGRQVERAEWLSDDEKWRVFLAPTTEDEGDDAEGERAIVADLVWAACGEVVDASRDPALRDLSRCGGLVRGGFPVLVEENDAPNAEADESPAGAASPAALGSLRWPGAPLYFVGAYASLSVGPAATTPAGHRMAALAVIAAMRTHARESRRGRDPYVVGLTKAQTLDPIVSGGDVARDDADVPLKLRLVPATQRHRALMDARELAPRDGGKVNMRELTEYQIVDEEFIIEVRLNLPEAVPPSRVRVAFTANSLEVFALGKEVAHRFFIPKLYKPVVVERCSHVVSTKKKRISVILHKYDNQPWRFLKG